MKIKGTQGYSLDIRENAIRAKNDPDYLGEVLLANESLIWYSMHKYIGNPEYVIRNSCLEKDDLLQVGRIGFIKAVNAFDVDRGVRFSSFAVVAIVREVRCFIRDHHSIIRLTRTANDLIVKIRRLEVDLGYRPPPEFISDILRESKEKVVKALQVGQQVKYLDEPINDSPTKDATLLDLLEDGTDIEDSVSNKLYVDNLIEAVKKVLSKREKEIFELRLNGLNQTQVAKKINVSPMKVSRVMQKITRLLKYKEKHL